MLSEDGKHMYVSWDEYHALIEKLALRIHQSGWEFDQILCLARGGSRPGDILSRIFSKPLAIMATSAYRDGASERGALDIARTITMARGELQGNVLLVDDLADSGETLKAVGDRVRSGMPGIREMRSAVLWVKGVSTVLPDYYVDMLPSSPWIHQPFEDYDSIRPAKLAERWKI